MSDLAPAPAWARPTTLATAALAYAVVHAVSGLALALAAPSLEWTVTAYRVREAFATPALIIAVAGLTLAVDRHWRTLRDGVLPGLWRAVGRG